jgi:hypothetical protein
MMNQLQRKFQEVLVYEQGARFRTYVGVFRHPVVLGFDQPKFRICHEFECFVELQSPRHSVPLSGVQLSIL